MGPRAGYGRHGPCQSRRDPQNCRHLLHDREALDEAVRRFPWRLRNYARQDMYEWLPMILAEYRLILQDRRKRLDFIAGKPR